MLSFDMKKPKAISMPVLVEGIDQSALDFKFVVEINGVSYGFPAIHENDIIKFHIPALDDVVKHLVEGTYEARLEASSITQGDSGYFMQPWADTINVKQSVSVAVSEEKVAEITKEEPKKAINLKLASVFVEENIEEVCSKPKEEKEKKEKNDAMRKKLLN